MQINIIKCVRFMTGSHSCRCSIWLEIVLFCSLRAVMRTLGIFTRHYSFFWGFRCYGLQFRIGIALVGLLGSAIYATRPLRWFVDTFDALGLTPCAFRRLTTTPSFSRVTIGTG